MYPYNVGNNITSQSFNHQLSSQVSTPMTNSVPTINSIPAPDKKLVEMVEEAIRQSQADADYYLALSKLIRDVDDSEIIRGIYANEQKHKKFFQEIYCILTGQDFPTPQGKAPQPSPILKENYAQGIFHALNNVVFYRQIYQFLENCDAKDMAFEALTDEQNNAIKLNYLFAK